MISSQPLTIGRLAKNANVTLETIRYYQRKGLLTEPDKPTTGYRQYPTDAIARIKFIKSAQQAGFTLKEIAELLALDNQHCDEARQLAEQKYQQIDEQLKNLQLLRHGLEHLIKGCLDTGSTGHCALIEAFVEQST